MQSLLQAIHKLSTTNSAFRTNNPLLLVTVFHANCMPYYPVRWNALKLEINVGGSKAFGKKRWNTRHTRWPHRFLLQPYILALVTNQDSNNFLTRSSPTSWQNDSRPWKPSEKNLSGKWTTTGKKSNGASFRITESWWITAHPIRLSTIQFFDTTRESPLKSRCPWSPFKDSVTPLPPLLIAEHQDLKTISRRLDHAQISTTMNIYAHALNQSDRKAADALESMPKSKW